IGDPAVCFAAFGVLVGVAPDGKWADPEFAIGLLLFYRLAEPDDDGVGVAAPPFTLAHPIAIPGIARIVREILAWSPTLYDIIGIKIIVEMDGVDIIPLYDIADDIRYIFLHFLVTRIEIKRVLEPHEPLGMFPGNMIRRDRRFPDSLHGPVRVAPCMEFHSPPVCLFDHELQRVIIGRRRLPLHPREPFAPWFVWRRIERIGG